MSKVLQERGFGSLPNFTEANLRGASVSVMPLSTYFNLGLGELAHTKLTVELADRTMKYPKGIAENVQVALSYIAIWDLILRLCHRLIACCITGKSQAPKKVTMANLFYLRGMDVVSVNIPYLLAKYLRLFAAARKSGAHISGGQFVARLAKHFGLLTVAAGGAPKAAEDAPVVVEGDQAVLAPVQAP
ncbi:hypothetical protein Tco_0339908 [Tanacetum coccineum]